MRRRALGIRRFVLAGHGYGGAVAAAYSAAHPERVAGIALVDSVGSVTRTDEVAARTSERLRLPVVVGWSAKSVGTRDYVRCEPLGELLTRDPATGYRENHGLLLVLVCQHLAPVQQ